ncbi:MAG: hypothetical protein AABZ06_05740 [Bdellovibrionota bacterium]
MIKIKGFHIVILFIWFFIAINAHSSDVLEDNKRYYRDVIPGVSVLFRGTSLNITSLKPDLALLKEHPLFKERLPKKWGVIIEGKLGDTRTTNTSSDASGASPVNPPTEGYFSPDLKLQENGDPAIPAIMVRESALTIADERLRILTHELTHLVHYFNQPREESWVREGAALLAEYIVTKYQNRALLSGFSIPETSLTADLKVHENSTESAEEKSLRLARYGHVLQYFYYLYHICDQDILNKLISRGASIATQSGIARIDTILKVAASASALPPACQDFKTSFVEFQKARFFPKPYPAQAYVLLGNFKATRRSSRLENPPPFSAQAYPLDSLVDSLVDSQVNGQVKNLIKSRGASGGSCPTNAIKMETNWCLEITH